MKKIAVYSDLHLDSWMPYYEFERTIKSLNERAVDAGADIIVYAGDFWNGANMFRSSIHEWCEESPASVMCNVMGNHDYYHTKFPTTLTHSGIPIYHNISGFGTSLWTDFWGDSPFKDSTFSQINDKYLVEGATAQKLVDRQRESFKLIERSKAEVIVTHWPPSEQSTAEQFKGDALNSYFVNQLDDRIVAMDTPPKLWICGHVHHKHSYYIGETLVVCNPLGYMKENLFNIDEYEPMIIEKYKNKWRLPVDK